MYRKLKLTIIGNALLLLLTAGLPIAVWGIACARFVWLRHIGRAGSLLCGIWILSQKKPAVIQMFWLMALLAVPEVGWLVYGVLQHFGIAASLRKRWNLCRQQALGALPKQPPAESRLAQYLESACGIPAYRRTTVQFYAKGDRMLKDYLESLCSAKQTIFIEYFLFRPGQIWDQIHDILRKKAEQGVSVYVMFDALANTWNFNKKQRARLEREGIHTAAFNPFHWYRGSFLNYRDHRKLTVIDNTVAWIGGMNLADEYFNCRPLRGIWKDCALRLCGDAVPAVSALFSEHWHFTAGQPPKQSEPTVHVPVQETAIQPIQTAPPDTGNTARQLYEQLLHRVRSCLYLTTPYLVPDAALRSTLCRLAQSGVDVRILTPCLYDKWYVHAVTRANYLQLLQAGIQIYEYTPGFVHEKVVIADDTVLLGSINLDFRSLYFLFENGVVLHGGETAAEIKTDYLETLTESRPITEEECRPLFRRLFGAVMRLLSPFF